MDFGTYVRVRSILAEIFVDPVHLVSHYALRGVADLLVPSSSAFLQVRLGHRQHYPSASLRAGVVSHLQGLGSLPAPPDWSAASLSLR